ncbi:MAG: hypothetical protein WAS55_08465 [Saprospiraceae bacterium]
MERIEFFTGVDSMVISLKKKTYEIQIQTYRKNPVRPTTYDLIEDSCNGEAIGLPYFVLSPPREDRYKKQGAILMMESWNHNKKVFFTGLREFQKRKRIYWGNHIKSNKKKSLFCLIQFNDLFEIHYFDELCPNGIRKQLWILSQYLIKWGEWRLEQRNLTTEIKDAEVTDAKVTDY